MKLPKTINRVTGEPSWRYRRLVAFGGIIYCGVVQVVMIDAADTALNNAIVWGNQWLFGVLVLVYSGLATVQDVVAIITTRSARPYAEQTSRVEVETSTKSVTVEPDPTQPPDGFAE